MKEKVKEFWKKHKAEICVIGGTLAVGAMMYYKLDKMAATVGLSVKDLSNKVDVDIDKTIIDTAVQKAVDREVRDVVSQASRTVVREISYDMSNQVKSAVSLAYPDVKKAVTSEIAKQASRINVSELKKEVTAEAKEAILEKFDGDLDDLLVKFNSNLDNVSKIYESIANTMTKKQDKETVLKIM